MNNSKEIASDAKLFAMRGKHIWLNEEFLKQLYCKLDKIHILDIMLNLLGILTR